MADRVYLYDTTLRDGAQTQDVDFTVIDKQEITGQLDTLGIDFIEGGFPGANPTDNKFFDNLPALQKSKMLAFGMTRRANTTTEHDPGLNNLVKSGVKQACIFGKSSDFHVTETLGTTPEENLNMIADSISYLKSKNIKVFFDAEHFFDGYKANPDYAPANPENRPQGRGGMDHPLRYQRRHPAP